MTTLRQAAQQALEALCSAVEPLNGKVYARGFEPIDCYVMHEQAIAALRTALEQPEQQAVFDCPRCGHVCAQRPWQSLTPDEVKHLYPYGRSVWGRETFEAIEKALKEKNT